MLFFVSLLWSVFKFSVCSFFVSFSLFCFVFAISNQLFMIRAFLRESAMETFFYNKFFWENEKWFFLSSNYHEIGCWNDSKISTLVWWIIFFIRNSSFKKANLMKMLSMCFFLRVCHGIRLDVICMTTHLFLVSIKSLALADIMCMKQ